MAFFFGDSFDLYTNADFIGYWDASSTVHSQPYLQAGRFQDSRALQMSGANEILEKTSASNDGIHHFVFSILLVDILSGSSNDTYITIYDGTTAQCTISFQSGGQIVLQAGGVGGTALATYTGAMTANNTWYAFEVEVVINNTIGSFAVRKNGNTSNDFSVSSLNTRASANNYANKIRLGQTANSSGIDDFLWRSDASSVPWVGDIRAYIRRPTSDQSVQWTPSGAVAIVNPVQITGSTSGLTANQAQYMTFTTSYSGTIGSATINCTSAMTGNVKAAIFASNGSAPTTILGAVSNAVNNPGVGAVTFTFPTPPSVTQGTQYWIGFISDNSTGSFSYNAPGAPNVLTYLGVTNTPSYAGFPVASPSHSTSGVSNTYSFTIAITPGAGASAPMVCDFQEDSATTFVFSSTIGQADLYGLSAITGTPTSIVGCVTRAFAEKSDAGARNISLNLKSGATTSNGTSVALNTTWSWIYRTDLTDPATGAAWTPTGVNNLQIGQSVMA